MTTTPGRRERAKAIGDRAVALADENPPRQPVIARRDEAGIGIGYRAWVYRLAYEAALAEQPRLGRREAAIEAAAKAMTRVRFPNGRWETFPKKRRDKTLREVIALVNAYETALADRYEVDDPSTGQPLGYPPAYEPTRNGRSQMSDKERDAMEVAYLAHAAGERQDNKLARIEREVFEASWQAARDFYAPHADEANAQRQELGWIR